MLVHETFDHQARLFLAEPALLEVRGVQFDADGETWRYCGADGADHGEGESHPPLEIAAPGVIPLIRTGGEELREEVTVRPVNLDAVEARGLGDHGCSREAVDDVLDLF